MTYLSVTNSVASWMRGKSGAIEGLYKLLESEVDGKNVIEKGMEVSCGQIRVSRSQSGDEYFLWDTDYLSGTGEESWGVIDIGASTGLYSGVRLGYVVLERELHVIDQRLQGLKIDGALFPRIWDGNVHSCLAGRGNDARKHSIAYFERHIGGQVSALPALICVGPMDDFHQLIKSAAHAGNMLPDIVTRANVSISSTRKVSPAGNAATQAVHAVFSIFTESSGEEKVYQNVQVEVGGELRSTAEKHVAATLTYSQWLELGSPLSPAQRRILLSDAILHHPLRIVGPAGSGKSLLMQLLVVRRIKDVVRSGIPVKLLYVAHNREMARSVRQRFEVLLADDVMALSEDVTLDVETLSDMSRDRLDVGTDHVIDTDAEVAKNYQLEVVLKELDEALLKHSGLVQKNPVLSSLQNDAALKRVFAKMVVSEISLAIKGQGLQKNRRRYVESEKALSRLHGALSAPAREFVFDIFEGYNREVFDKYGLLDSDDLAISLLGKLRTPIWELRRKSLGYDFLFVDETQLFNENERRIFPLLCKSLSYVPIVLALDEAQSIFGQSSAGFAALGIENISNESLPSIHRSTKSIVDLAFFVVQHCGDLFGPDFPDFTDVADGFAADDHPLATKPALERCPTEQASFGKFVRKRVSELRKSNQRQIAVVIHGSRYWEGVRSELATGGIPFVEVLSRGESLAPGTPVVALTRPEFIGGQEFDAVIIVGLEQGVVPPALSSNEPFNIALEQQTLREIYLSITRARYRVVFAISTGATPTSIIADAIQQSLIV